jgi:hypothetical protein
VCIPSGSVSATPPYRDLVSGDVSWPSPWLLMRPAPTAVKTSLLGTRPPPTIAGSHDTDGRAAVHLVRVMPPSKLRSRRRDTAMAAKRDGADSWEALITPLHVRIGW